MCHDRCNLRTLLRRREYPVVTMLQGSLVRAFSWTRMEIRGRWDTLVALGRRTCQASNGLGR